MDVGRGRWRGEAVVQVRSEASAICLGGGGLGALGFDGAEALAVEVGVVGEDGDVSGGADA